MQDIKFEEKFDYITMIGILEYAPRLIASSSPYEDLIKFAKNLLKPDGKILLAVDNRLGSKFFVGGKSEHYNKCFDSISGKNDGTSKLFTRYEIQNLLIKCDFLNYKFYYPLPDYKFTTVIFSDEYLPENNSKLLYNPVYNADSTIIASEMDMIKEYNYNNEFKNHANSFLIEVNCNLKDNKIRFVNYNNLRKKKYSLNLNMYQDRVEKKAASKEGIEHINSIKNNIELLKSLGVTIDEEVNNDIIISKLVEKEQFSNVLYKNLKENNINEFYDNINSWYEYVCNILSKQSETREINKDLLDFNVDQSLLDEMNIIEHGFIDLVFENTFFGNKSFAFIDQEWYIKNIPIQYILYRAINNFYTHNSNINAIIKLEDVLEKYELLKFKEVFDKMEVNFQNLVIDKEMLYFYNLQVKYYKNIEEIVAIEKEINYFENGKVELEEIKKLYRRYIEQVENTKKLSEENEKMKKHKTCLETEIASYKDSRMFRMVLKINNIFRKR